MEEQIDEETKHQRVEKVMLAQQKIAVKKNMQMAGRELVCLVDQAGRGGKATGRYYGQAPHIDSVCCIQKGRAKTGQFIRAKVTGGEDYDLHVRKI